ncbi:MAG: Gfo/Idh/MocA family oxidoreductase [Anaerolineae bacterium]|nr:Gfo/Idh/MocA family oxidoreductase [Anaerolineae bacterium]
MTLPLKVAIVGAGRWGANYIRVFTELPGTQVAVVCDMRADRLDEIRRRFPGVEVATDFGEALRKYDVDAAVISTPAQAHYDVTRLALEAGKHVLVEKPMTTLAEESEELVVLAEDKKLILMVGHIFLYNPGVRKVKSCIESGGNDVYYMYARRTNLGPIRSDVNAIWDLAPHDVSIFNYLLDSVPQWVSAVGAQVLQSSCEDIGFISLGYPNGVIGHIHVSWAEPNKVREVVVVGGDKRIVFNDLNPQEQVRVFEKGVKPVGEPTSYGEYQFFVRDGDIISPKVEAGEPLKSQCMHFVECVAEGKQPLSDGKNGWDVVRVMEAIDRSVAQHGMPVELS